jgi:hypothetical protein
MSQKAGIGESSRRKRWLVCGGITILVLLSIAVAGCLAPPLPPGVEVAQEVSPSATPTATNTPLPEWPPTWTPTPTYTPWPTMTPTPTPTPIPTLPSSSSASFRQTTCSGVTQGPLKIDYENNPGWCPAGGPAYVADFTISASGGDGCYIYYRDIDLIEGPTRKTSVTYQLKWARCGGAPGTLTVQSGDGQEVSVKFWVRPPECCKD